MEMKYGEELITGLSSTVSSVGFTYLVSTVFPTTDLQWALIAVGFAGFFSGFFGRYYAE